MSARRRNADDAEAFARRMRGEPEVVLTGAEAGAVRRALAEANIYASRRFKIAPNQTERIRAQAVLDAVKEALPALDPAARPRRADTS